MAFLPPVAVGNLVLGGCCIRFDTKNADGTLVVPRIHEDDKHQSLGVTGLNVNTAGNLEIFTDPGAATQVVTCFTNPDETMTRAGVTCGPSGGLTETTIKFNLDGVPVRADDEQLHHTYANLWCFWVWFNPSTPPIQSTITDLQARLTALENGNGEVAPL